MTRREDLESPRGATRCARSRDSRACSGRLPRSRLASLTVRAFGGAPCGRAARRSSSDVRLTSFGSPSSGHRRAPLALSVRQGPPAEKPVAWWTERARPAWRRSRHVIGGRRSRPPWWRPLCGPYPSAARISHTARPAGRGLSRSLRRIIGRCHKPFHTRPIPTDLWSGKQGVRTFP